MTVVGVIALAGCALPSTADDGALLEPMHGAIDPEGLDRRAERATDIAEPPPAAEGAEWRVASAVDGRTLELYQGLERATATLGGIEVPTGDDCLAQLATDSLSFVTGGGRVVDVSPAAARNGRIDDATIIGADGDDLAVVMLSLGLARATEGGADPDAYREAEAAARDDALGLWSDDCPD